eukprot:scaffold137314_cov18-Prasinocladus_malaysianus.AAC.1
MAKTSSTPQFRAVWFYHVFVTCTALLMRGNVLSTSSSGRMRGNVLGFVDDVEDNSNCVVLSAVGRQYRMHVWVPC